VRAEFPEMAGVKPTISEKRTGSKSRNNSKSVFILTFRKKVPLPGGNHITRTVRVTMGQEGDVIKLSSSK
jgi:hypothetical protein